MYTPNPKSKKKLSVSQTTRELHEQSRQAVQSLNEQASGSVHVRWNRRTGHLRSVQGLLSEPLSGTPQEMARQFLREQHAVFGLPADLADVECIHTEERRGVKHVVFRQMHEGLPVAGAELIVHIDRANRVQMVNGEYYPEIELAPSSPDISDAAAIEAAMTDLGISQAQGANVRVERVVFPKGCQYYRTYEVTFSSKDPLGDWVYFVNAANGDILESYNAMFFIVKGKGQLYHTNPERDDDVVTAELFDLYGNGKLIGTYFIMKNDGSAGDAAPTGPELNDFLYADPADPHFDEVMAYYHLSKVAEFFRNLGHDKHAVQMNAHVHVPDPVTGDVHYDNAYFSPLDNAIYFGDGKDLNDLAQEAAVIYHEYSHSVVHAIQPFMGTYEAGALHEGYADYFACSLSNDPKIGEFVISKAGEEYLRNLRSEKTYDDFNGDDMHLDGEIWGSTCWQIHESLGRDVADELMYESLWYLPQNATFQDAREGILQADAMLFEGDHLAELEEIFEERQIGAEPGDTYTIMASTNEGGQIVPSGEVVVDAGADQTFTFEAESGYVLHQVLVDGEQVEAETEYTFQQVSADHSIEALFEAEGNVIERTVILPGNTDWVESGLTVEKGAIITFSAHGKVFYDNQGNSCGPGGTSWTDTQDQEDPLWQSPHAGVIGKIEGIGLPFFIGENLTVRAGSSGKLLLGVNDFWYQGNSGEFSVTIHITTTAA